MKTNKPSKILFARIGWMKFYTGPQAGDEKPIGGGEYTKHGIGGEVFNFLNVGDRFYGYLQPHARFNDNAVTINLERISPDGVSYANNSPYQSMKDCVRNVLVIFVARSPAHGQVIVGWYKNATVYRGHQKLRRKVPVGVRAHWYNIVAKPEDCLLLPTRYRNHSIPTGKGAIGQANAFYLYDQRSTDPQETKQRASRWISNAIDYVNEYSGDNLASNPEVELQKEVEEIHEKNLEAQSGQGFSVSPETRKAIENYAVKKAIAHFTAKGWSVKNVGDIKSYDLECLCKNKRLHVEVKGTTTSGKSIMLTANEIKNAHKSRTALYVVHSIRIGKRNQLSGGKVIVRDPWLIDKHGTKKAIAYVYELNE